MVEGLEPAARPRHASFTLPAGACDTHAHIMGPFDRFPLPPEHSYVPELHPIEDYLAVLDGLGIERAVIVHSSAHGRDCRVLVDALQRFPDRLRGVALAGADITDAALVALSEAGVKGLRFAGTTHANKARSRGSVPFEDLYALAPRMRERRLHAQIWLHYDQFMEQAPELTKLGLPIVLDHMGRLEPERGVTDPSFRFILGQLREGRLWVKLKPSRNSKQLPDYPDMRPFHDAYLAANPDRLVWGSDWPHSNLSPAPETADLLRLFGEWTSDAASRTKILVTNPARLYGF
jgi:predicted TIM-barrel fold metal-dependent hydrolase